MIKTIYKCDKCGNEQDNEEQFWAVGVTAELVKYVDKMFIAPKISIQVCRTCLESFGIHAKPKPENLEQEKLPTIEELIVEIVQRTMEV